MIILIERIKIPVVSGGDGTGNHPSQSLLDLMTIREEFGHFEGLKVVIVGDILHSRVAHSNYDVMQRLGMQVYTSGPLEYKQDGYNYVDFDDVKDKVSAITPVPGGIGPMTITMLMKNTIEAFYHRNGD